VTVAGGRRAKKLTATVVVLQGRDGKQVGKMVVKERRGKLAASVGKQAWKKLGRAITGAKARTTVTEPVAVAPAPPPPSPTSEPTEAAPVALSEGERSEPESQGSADSLSVSTTVRTSPAASRRVPRFTISVDERPFIRRLRWNDDIAQVLRRYDLAANAVGVTVAARPFRGFTAAYVQLAGEMAVGVNGSRTDEGMEFGTSSSELSATAGLTFHLARAELGVAAAYGEHRFEIDGDQGMGGELVPDVTYRYARGGLDVRWPLAARWTLTGRGGYRHLLGTGDLGNGAWFPRSSGKGLDGSAGIHLHLARWLGAYARAEVRHYFFAMNPEIGDELIAGGAVDTFFGGAIGFAVAVP
jgi:hypothetical protein